MSDRSSSEFSGFLSGLLVGGLVGAAVALLTAPHSGEETRRIIRDRSIELRDTASESLEAAAADARARADELTKMAKERAEEVSKYAKDQTAGLRKSAEDLKARGEAAIEAAKKSPK
ncbi:MAG TPA: YtxH domain-containing protein [Anaerolineales bacterium]|nr:YtxH domain-containing protein [Anaerolineales bacterium]HRQ91250.1 YtxH domain-containing protein [Anaerolineales bacterium]